jgi:hypothetical protein
MHPLTLEFTEQDDGLLCVLEFNPVLMPEEHVTVILEALPRVLSGLVEGLGPREILTAVAVGQSGAGLASA